MAKYQNTTETTVADSSAAIITGLSAGAQVEVTSVDAVVWIHPTGGTAAVHTAPCIPCPDGGYVIIDIEDSTTQLTAIRDSATSGRVTASVVSG